MITQRSNLNDGGNVLDVLLNSAQEHIETKIDEWLPSGTPVNTTVSQSQSCPPGYEWEFMEGGGANAGRCVQINTGNNSSTPNGSGTLPSNYFESGTYNLPPSNSGAGLVFKPQETLTYAKPKGAELYFEKRQLDTRDFDCGQLNKITDSQKRWLESNPLVYQKIQAICTDRVITPANTWFGISPIWYFVVGALILLFFSIPKRAKE